MNLKEKILQLLELKKISYADLAAYLQLSEQELDLSLKNNTLEIRTLELISKELRIPLYSFFRENIDELLPEKEPYYTVNIWDKEDATPSQQLKSLQQEIEELRAAIHQRDLLIEALEGQLTNLK